MLRKIDWPLRGILPAQKITQKCLTSLSLSGYSNKNYLTIQKFNNLHTQSFHTLNTNNHTHTIKLHTDLQYRKTHNISACQWHTQFTHSQFQHIPEYTHTYIPKHTNTQTSQYTHTIELKDTHRFNHKPLFLTHSIYTSALSTPFKNTYINNTLHQFPNYTLRAAHLHTHKPLYNSNDLNNNYTHTPTKPYNNPYKFDPLEADNVLQNQLRIEKRQMNRVFFAAILTIFLIYLLTQLQDVQFWGYDVITHILIKYVDPEFAHELVILLAKWGLLPLDLDRDDPSLRITVGGVQFPNPIGLAAGFDKHAEGVLSFMRMGFGFVEVGTVTPLPQSGNPKPRLFRLTEDKAIINRYGFNSQGCDQVKPRLEKISEERWKHSLTAWNVLGVNIGKNKTTVDSLSDIEKGVEKLGKFGDYLVINISSPNTPNLRDLQKKNEFEKVIMCAKSAIANLSSSTHTSNDPHTHSSQPNNEHTHTQSVTTLNTEANNDTDNSSTDNHVTHTLTPAITTHMDHPHFAIKHTDEGTVKVKSHTLQFPNQKRKAPLLFIKISPDLDEQSIQDISEVALKHKVDGLIVSNTTIGRPELISSNKSEVGGLSGRPLKDLATEMVGKFYRYTHGDIPIIASGGVETGQDALDKIEAGASLVQVYTSMIYGGPSIARRIKDELSYLLYRKGYHTVKSAVGIKWAKTIKKRVKAPTFD